MQRNPDDTMSCDRDAWEGGNVCTWTGARKDAGQDDGGAITYCPSCGWMIEVDA